MAAKADKNIITFERKPVHGRQGKEYTFKNGFTVWLKPAAPTFEQDIIRALPQPEPPREKIDLGDGKFSIEPNFDHPTYLYDYSKWALEYNKRVLRFLAFYCVEFDFTEEMKKQVEKLRTEYRDLGLEIDPSDKVAYIHHFLVSNGQELAALSIELGRISKVTEEAVSEMVESFPDNGTGA